MKKKNITIILFILAVSLLLGSVFYSTNSADESDNECIGFTIKSNKNLYLESEPIWIEYLAILDKKCNFDGTPALSLIGNVSIELLNSKGEKINYDGSEHALLPIKRNKDTLFNADNILLFYGVPYDFENSRALMYLYMPADNYFLTAKLEYYIDNKSVEIVSGTITFEVKKTEGFETEARELLIKIGEARAKLKSAEFIKNIIDQFYLNYSNSVFRERIDYEMIVLGFPPPISLLPQNEQINFIIKHLNDFKNDNFNSLHLNQLANYYNNKRDFENVLMNQKLNAKGTNLEKYIVKKIEEIKKQE